MGTIILSMECCFDKILPHAVILKHSAKLLDLDIKSFYELEPFGVEWTLAGGLDYEQAMEPTLEQSGIKPSINQRMIIVK